MAVEREPATCAVGPCSSPREYGSFYCAKHGAKQPGTAAKTNSPSARSKPSSPSPGNAPGKAAMWVFAVIVVLIVVVVAAVHAGSSKSGENSSADGGWASALPSRAIALAHQGNPDNIHIAWSTTKPFEGCPRPNWYGWTTSTGRQLAADELAWFIAHASAGSCPSFLYLFHDATQSHRPGYNAGAVIHEGGLELDVGSMIDGSMYDFRTS